MKLAPLFRRRTVWFPTRWGLLLFIAVGCLFGAILLLGVEPFLSVTNRVPADVLVVEGWIGKDGVEAAAEEFRSGGYQVAVAAGGFNSTQQYSFAEVAQRQLRQFGVPAEKIILARTPNVGKQRTFYSAASVQSALASEGIRPVGLNVFTRGPHARRSWVVYGKSSDGAVGVISWVPSRDQTVNWWDSSERIRDLLAEGCGYFYERLLNSGRLSNHSPILTASTPPASGAGERRE